MGIVFGFSGSIDISHWEWHLYRTYLLRIIEKNCKKIIKKLACSFVGKESKLYYTQNMRKLIKLKMFLRKK